MLHYATEKVSMHLIGRICSIRRFDFSSIIVEQLYISERKKKSCIRSEPNEHQILRFQRKNSTRSCRAKRHMDQGSKAMVLKVSVSHL